ncbi:unnamed protein product [Closterium sp. NIES-64]|nr:unnamed protein product [Closterium sp. NIES-64]
MDPKYSERRDSMFRVSPKPPADQCQSQATVTSSSQLFVKGSPKSLGRTAVASCVSLSRLFALLVLLGCAGLWPAFLRTAANHADDSGANSGDTGSESSDSLGTPSGFFSVFGGPSAIRGGFSARQLMEMTSEGVLRGGGRRKGGNMLTLRDDETTGEGQTENREGGRQEGEGGREEGTEESARGKGEAEGEHAEEAEERANRASPSMTPGTALHTVVRARGRGAGEGVAAPGALRAASGGEGEARGAEGAGEMRGTEGAGRGVGLGDVLGEGGERGGERGTESKGGSVEGRNEGGEGREMRIGDRERGERGEGEGSGEGGEKREGGVGGKEGGREGREGGEWGWRWVDEKDASWPLYSAASCPFIFPGQNCRSNGRNNTRFERYAWRQGVERSGEGREGWGGVEEGEEAEGKERSWCDALQGVRHGSGVGSATPVTPNGMMTRVAYIGDSMMRNMFESMACMLHAHPRCGGNPEVVRANVVERIIRWDTCNVTLANLRSNFLTEISFKDPTDEFKGATLHLSRPDKRWKQRIKNYDVFVINSGHWWTRGKLAERHVSFSPPHKSLNVLSAFRRAIRTTLHRFASRQMANKTVIITTSSPNHFSHKPSSPHSRDPTLSPHSFQSTALNSLEFPLGQDSDASRHLAKRRRLLETSGAKKHSKSKKSKSVKKRGQCDAVEPVGSEEEAYNEYEEQWERVERLNAVVREEVQEYQRIQREREEKGRKRVGESEAGNRRRKLLQVAGDAAAAAAAAAEGISTGQIAELKKGRQSRLKAEREVLLDAGRKAMLKAGREVLLDAGREAMLTANSSLQIVRFPRHGDTTAWAIQQQGRSRQQRDEQGMLHEAGLGEGEGLRHKGPPEGVRVKSGRREGARVERRRREEARVESRRPEGARVVLLEVAVMSVMRHDGHPGAFSGLAGGQADCAHWCLPGVPDAWNEQLLRLLC